MQQGAAPAQDCGGCGLGGCASCDIAWRTHREEQARRATAEELADLRKLAEGAAPLGWDARLNVIPAVVDELIERRSIAPTPEYVSGWLACQRVAIDDVAAAYHELMAPSRLSSEFFARRIRALAPPSPEGASNDRLLLLKALLRGGAGLMNRLEPYGQVIATWGREWNVTLDPEGFPVLTEDLRAALIEATEATT